MHVLLLSRAEEPPPPTECREAYIAADVVERQVEELYRKVQLPPHITERLLTDLQAEVVVRQSATLLNVSSWRSG